MTKWLVFLLEEPSIKAMLEGFLPTIAGDDAFLAVQYMVFEGKQDLEKNLVRRLRHWNRPGPVRFVVIRDQDAEDCVAVKARLRGMCEAAGYPDALVRIACRELESWFLGDLAAVERWLGLKGVARQQRKEKYRDPDRLIDPKRELRILTDNAYQAVQGSRRIGPHLHLTDNISHSFNVFVSGLGRHLERLRAAGG